MKFVRSQAEVQSMLKTFTNPVFLDCKMLVALFRTTPEFVRRVLPPPLEPSSRPFGSMSIFTTGKSNCAGSFNGGSITLRARYKSIEGDYALTMPMNSDTAVIFGRELFGEPKKMAEVDLSREGGHHVGSVKRNGKELMRMTGLPTGPAQTKNQLDSDSFHFKYTFSADGTGLDHNPRLVHVRFSNTVRSAESCFVEVQLWSSVDDVYGEIPVEEVLGGAYLECDLSGQARNIAEVEKDIFLPYAFRTVDQYDRFNS